MCNCNSYNKNIVMKEVELNYVYKMNDNIANFLNTHSHLYMNVDIYIVSVCRMIKMENNLQ